MCGINPFLRQRLIVKTFWCSSAANSLALNGLSDILVARFPAAFFCFAAGITAAEQTPPTDRLKVAALSYGR